MPKLSIIVSSEKLDKLYPVAILTSGAATMGWEVEVFFTFFGLLALKRGYRPSTLSSDYRGYEETLREAVAKGTMPGWEELIVKAKETGRVRIFACTTTMGLFKIGRDDLKDFVDDVAGAATFLQRAKDSDITLFLT